jgi:hypothetical protein
MTYSEWVQKHGPIDRMVRQVLPPDEEVGRMTFEEIIEKFGEKIRQVGKGLGIELTDDDILDILGRIYLPEMPPFHRSHYDLHC